MHDRSKKQPDHLPIPATRQATDPRIADGAGLGGPTLWGRWQSFSKNSPTRPGHGPRDRPLFFVHYHWPAGGMPRKSMLFPECDAKVSFAENGVGNYWVHCCDSLWSTRVFFFLVVTWQCSGNQHTEYIFHCLTQ